MRRKPASGASSTIQAEVVISALELSQLVDVDRQAAAEDRHDQAEADGDLAGRDDHHDQREDLAVAVPVHARERDEREVGGVEHQLDAEQDHERVAPHEHAAGPDREDQRRDHEVPLHAHRCGSPPASIMVPAGASMRVPASPRITSPTEISRGSSRPLRRRARMTAPTAAMSSSSDATSNATRNFVRNRRPISAAVPKPVSAASPLAPPIPAPSVLSASRPEPSTAMHSSANSAPANSIETIRSPPLPPLVSGASWPPT